MCVITNTTSKEFDSLILCPLWTPTHHLSPVEMALRNLLMSALGLGLHGHSLTLLVSCDLPGGHHPGCSVSHHCIFFVTTLPTGDVGLINIYLIQQLHIEYPVCLVAGMQLRNNRNSPGSYKIYILIKFTL